MVARSVSILAPGYVVSERETGRRSGGAVAVADEGESIFAGLREAEFQLAASYSLVPETRARRAGATEPVQVAVPVAPGEAAVLLLEDANGLLGWRFPDAAAISGRRTGTAVGVQHFTISATASGPQRDGRRSFLTDWALETVTRPVRVRVLRFLARRTVDAAIMHVEGGLKAGPVLVTGNDPARWYPGIIGQIAARVPADRPARVLLLVHGTFSSTAGSFAALAGHPLLGTYDLVMGYDHRTLGEDPLDNAAALLAALHALDLAPGSVIDAIAFSRGGLVYRALAERLAPASALAARFGRAVFVGCTNAGTTLAEPDNWKTLLDLYTNALVAGARIGLALAGAGAAGPFVSAALRTMGGFAQMLSQVAITERRAPGLAAMEPHSELVEALNGAPLPQFWMTRYFAVTSDFEPGDGVALAVLDRIADRLHGAANDMVVPTASMTDLGSARRIEATTVLPAASGTYHTIYFASPTVKAALGSWLGSPSAVPVAAPMPRPDEGARRASASDGFDRGRKGVLPQIDGRAGSWFGSVIGGLLPSRRPSPAGIAPEALPTAAPPSRPFTEAGIEPATTAFPQSPSPPTATPKPPAVASTGAEPELVAEPGSEPEPAPAAETVPQAATETTQRYLAAEMTPYPLLGTPTNLYVIVSPEAIVVALHQASATLDAPVAVDRARPLTIEIAPRFNCAVVGKDRHELAISGDEQVVKFALVGLGAGPAEVIVTARQGSRAVATFVLAPVFLEAHPAPLRAEAAPAPTGSVKGRAVLRIYEFKATDNALRLAFNLTSDDPEFAELDKLELGSGFKLEDFTNKVLASVEAAWGLVEQGTDQEIYNSFLKGMVSQAKVRTRDLIPEGIRRKLWDNRKAITEIQVISGEPLIPWELMYLFDPDGKSDDGEGWFAERGLTRWLHDAPLGRRRRRPGDGTLRHVIPDYPEPDTLAGAAEERAMLEGRFADFAAIPASSRAVRKFLSEEARDCAILHFACHGRALQEGTLSSGLLMLPRTNARGETVPNLLNWEDVWDEADFGDGGGPLVFVNACQTGRAGNAIASQAGFAKAFLRPESGRGAAAFIGALWSVDDTLAGTFAQRVYDGLAANLRLGEAVAAAREACKNSNDFTWLAYTVYANG